MVSKGTRTQLNQVASVSLKVSRRSTLNLH